MFQIRFRLSIYYGYTLVLKDNLSICLQVSSTILIKGMGDNSFNLSKTIWGVLEYPIVGLLPDLEEY